MGKGSFLKTLAGVAVLCFAMVYSAKADSFIPSSSTSTSSTFLNVTVYGFDGSSTANPWGLVNIHCPGGAVGCNTNEIFAGSDAATGHESATVVFSTTGFSISSSSPLTTNVTGGSSIFASGNTFNPLLLLLNTIAGVTGGTTNSWCALQGCNNANGAIELVNVGGVDVLEAWDTSIGAVFALPTASTPTPEPSSLLMLGVGLLGLMGLVLRRKSII